MRIGIDASILAPATEHTGIGRYVSTLVRHLPAAARDDEILLVAPAGVAPPGALPPNVEWLPIALPPLGKLSMLAAYQWSLPRLARKHRLDVFHAPTVHPRPTWPSVPRRMPCPLLVTVHDVIPLTLYSRGAARLPWRQRAFYRWNLAACRGAARVITVSEAARRELLAQVDINASRVTVVPNAVAIEHDGRVPADMPYVMYTGSFEARKNAITAVRAFARVAGAMPGHQLVLLAAPGSGDAGAVRAEIRRLGIEERVRFVAGVSDGELARLYAGASVVLFTSLAEGFGLPPIEALACSAPVVVSDLPALHEVLGDAALYADPLDDATFADAATRILTNDALRCEMARRGRERARCFSVDSFIDGMLGVYRSVMSETAPRNEHDRTRVAPPVAGDSVPEVRP